MKNNKTRIEHDALGEVRVPAARLWGAQTERALVNFPVGGSRYRWRPGVIRAIGMVKKCAALANGDLSALPPEKVGWIVAAADEVIAGRWDDEFPLGMFQSGSGTQSNMNANEVIANRANQLAGGRLGGQTPVRPNDDVNRSQSSNDVFPTVMHVATVDAVETLLGPALVSLRELLDARAAEFASLVIVGRTHLQDAVPMTLGQVISGWSAQVSAERGQIERTLAGVFELPMGGTAVGTGMNAPPRFAEAFIRRIAAETGRPYRISANRFAALSAHDALVNVSGSLRTLAGALLKIANDVRWYASGPRAGIGELTLPENEPGSSIMPGKINPTQCEVLTLAAVSVFGNDQAIAFAGSQGSFQLNTYKPLILHHLLESIQVLAESCRSFLERCLRGLTANEPRIRRNLERSLMLATALNPHIGYDKASQIALAAHHEGLTLRDAAIRLGFVTGDEFDRWVRPESMISPSPE